MKKHLSTIALILVLLAGVSLLLYPTVSDYWNARHASKAVADYTQNVQALDQDAYDELLAAAEDYNRSLLTRENGFFLTEEQQAQYESLLDISGTGIMGYIEIPSVRLPSTLKKIEKQAFMYAHNLTKITLPDGLETIGDEAFSGCHPRNAVVLPASIKSIGKKAFDRDGAIYGNLNEIPVGAYFLGDAPQIVGTGNANCSFPSDWTLYYLPGTSDWTGDTYEGYQIAPWDGETRWDNPHTTPSFNKRFLHETICAALCVGIRHSAMRLAASCLRCICGWQ